MRIFLISKVDEEEEEEEGISVRSDSRKWHHSGDQCRAHHT